MNEYIQEEIIITCPYCGEANTPLIDYSSGSQEYYEDCMVCCAPILFVLTRSEIDAQLHIEVRRDDD